MRNSIWKSMLDADMNARYWKALVSRYSRRDQVLKIFLAVMASGTVAGWGLWSDIPIAWKALSSISAIVAISLPILNYQKLIDQMSYLSGKWGELRIEYEDLWRQVQNTSTPESKERAYQKFRKIESTLQEKETKLPEDIKLLKKCQSEVCKSRDLKKGDK